MTSAHAWSRAVAAALLMVACAGDASEEAADSSEDALSSGADAVSFLVTSDLHFGKGESDEAASDEIGDDDAEETAAADPRSLFAKNQIAAKAMELARSPASRAAFADRGIANAFRGLLVTGDVTDDGQARQWDEFLATYENPAVFSLPVYETAGNHDYPITRAKTSYSRASDVLVPAKILARNASRRGVVARSPSGAYAVKWGDVLVVNLGVKASAKVSSLLATKSGGWRDTAPFESLRFLRQVLRDGDLVRRSTRVVLAFHYPMVAGPDRMSVEERRDLHDAIKDAPVVAIVHGHRHRSDAYAWCGVPVLEADTPGALTSAHDGTFIAAEISGRYLKAQTVSYRSDASGVKLGLDPSRCAVAEGSRCWSITKKLSDIKVAKSCDVSTVQRLR